MLKKGSTLISNIVKQSFNPANVTAMFVYLIFLDG